MSSQGHQQQALPALNTLPSSRQTSSWGALGPSEALARLPQAPQAPGSSPSDSAPAIPMLSLGPSSFVPYSASSSSAFPSLNTQSQPPLPNLSLMLGSMPSQQGYYANPYWNSSIIVPITPTSSGVVSPFRTPIQYQNLTYNPQLLGSMPTGSEDGSLSIPKAQQANLMPGLRLPNPTPTLPPTAFPPPGLAMPQLANPGQFFAMGLDPSQHVAGLNPMLLGNPQLVNPLALGLQTPHSPDLPRRASVDVHSSPSASKESSDKSSRQHRRRYMLVPRNEREEELLAQFATDRLMKSHVKGERGFQCDRCNYTTPQIGNLQQHLYSHEGVRPFKCPECDYASSFQSALVRHRQMHLKGKRLKCPYCNYRVNQTYNLRRHLARSHQMNAAQAREIVKGLALAEEGAEDSQEHSSHSSSPSAGDEKPASS